MDATVILVTAGAGIIIGLLLGLMINALRGDSSKNATPSEIKARGIDNILLWHDQEGGNLIVDLDDSTFIRVQDMRPDQRSRLDTVYTQLRRFMGIQDTGPRPAPATPPMEQTSPASFTQAESTEPGGPLKQTQPQPVQNVKVEATPKTTDVEPVIVDKKGAKKLPPEPIKPLNIVSEIDEILQDMIAGTPFLERGLQLVETASHTIAVWIDSQQFESIDAVTDPEVQQVIRTAVKKWENKPR